MTAKAVAKKEETELVVLDMFEADSGGGFENADTDSFAIPFIRILQSGSPQVKKSDGAYIKGAEEGMLFNSVTNMASDEPLLVVPVAYKREYVEWQPRDAGGGLVGRHDPVNPPAYSINDDGQMVTDSGTILTDTRMHYVLYKDAEGNWSPALIAMSGSQVKKSKKWMTMLQQRRVTKADGSSFNPPTYANICELSTVPESNDKGSWFSYEVKLERLVNVADPSEVALYNNAKDLAKQIHAGDVKASESSMRDDVAF